MESQVKMFEAARIGFKNFDGKEGQFNPKGNRNFVIFLDKDIAKTMEAAGWNIKWPKNQDALDPEDARDPYLPVTVGYKVRPPKMVLIAGKTKTLLDEEAVGMLDDVNIMIADIVVNASHWEVNGKEGYKAYVREGYFTIETTALYEKYGI